MTSVMKEIIKICTDEKVAKWLEKIRKPTDGDFFFLYDHIQIIVYEADIISDNYKWLPISFNTKHGCLQVEYLLMKKLGIKSMALLRFEYYYNEHSKHRCGYGKDSYTLQCLYWLKELIEEEA